MLDLICKIIMGISIVLIAAALSIIVYDIAKHPRYFDDDGPDDLSS